MPVPPDIVVEISERAPQPAWARLQRSLIDRCVDAVTEFVERYTRNDGTLVWRDRWPGIDGSDDPYEGFMYLALLGAITSDRSVVRAAHRMWDAITWQWTEYGQLRREFDRHYDWMHHGESNLFHYFFGLSDPASLKTRQRAARFAAMYDGTDPEAPNYDPELGIIRSSHTGSDGPLFTATPERLSTQRGVLDGYLAPFEDLESAPFDNGRAIRWSDDAVFAEIIEKMNLRTMRGDVPINLNATGQITNAFLYDSHEDRREWVTQYLGRWLARARENGGTVPDNVGPSGIVGELLDGKWWGGHYGWRWPHGWATIIGPVLNGCLNAHLLTGSPEQLELVRLQLDEAWDRGRRGDDGWEIPRKHFDSGWADYGPMNPVHPIQLWSRSMDDADLERVERIRAGRDWGAVSVPRVPFVTNHYLTHTLAWFEFVRGRNEGYLERVLTADHELLDQQLERLRSTEGDPEVWPTLRSIAGYSHELYQPQIDGYAIHLWQEFSPVHFESLIQTVFGAPAHISHGGLQFATVRPFDPQTREAGLPTDAAMAVTAIRPDQIEIDLAYHPAESGTPIGLVLQAGGFREHEFTWVRHGEQSIEFETPAREITIRLHPGSSTRLTVGLRRSVHSPSYATPFSSEVDWPPLIKGREGEDNLR